MHLVTELEMTASDGFENDLSCRLSSYMEVLNKILPICNSTLTMDNFRTFSNVIAAALTYLRYINAPACRCLSRDSVSTIRLMYTLYCSFLIRPCFSKRFRA
jgi:hypothetical protein